MSKARTRREDRPTIILDAAEALLRRSGGRTLTIDGVAAEAGLSKGGVLHHFASKDALITALARRKVERLREGTAAEAAALAGNPAAGALGMIAHARQTYRDECGFPDSLLLATVDNPDAVAALRAFVSERIAALEEGGAAPGAGMALLFAVIGLMVSRSLGFHQLEGEELERLFAALEAQAVALGR